VSLSGHLKEVLKLFYPFYMALLKRAVYPFTNWHIFEAILVEPQHIQKAKNTGEFNKKKCTTRAKIIS